MPTVHINTYCRGINLLNFQIVKDIGEGLKGEKFSCADVLLAL
jgi:hypothetical protein